MSDFAQRAVGHSAVLVVVHVEVHTDESAVPVVHPEKKRDCVDISTELAVRIDMGEEFLRRTLISRPTWSSLSRKLIRVGGIQS